ncbi:hypothetical protein AAMO2058_001670700 [Amorphochlora amoebiformis]
MVTKRFKAALALCDSMYTPRLPECLDILQLRLFEMRNPWLSRLHEEFWRKYNKGVIAAEDGTIPPPWLTEHPFYNLLPAQSFKKSASEASYSQQLKLVGGAALEAVLSIF